MSRKRLVSLRVKELSTLQCWLQSKDNDPHIYFVLTEEKSVGKSFLLEAALYRTAGVVSVGAEGRPQMRFAWTP